MDNNMNDKVIKNDNSGKIKQFPYENNKKYNNTNDIQEMIGDILTKFGDNENHMALVKGVIKSLVADGKGIRFEIPEDAEDFDPVNCENCEKKDSCDAYQRYDTITKSEGGSKAASANDERDWISLFGAPDIEELNRAISIFEEQFEDAPYLIMSSDTLKAFEVCTSQRTEASSCLDLDTGDVDCNDYNECEGCPFEPDDVDSVIIERDCQSGKVTAFYLHDEDDYTITIDNDLPFGVVKVR